MITLLDTLGPAIWRASWQAAALAILIFLVFRCLGERLSPRWRYWIWGIVLIRLLFVATPASPWSVFNLAHWNQNQESKDSPIAVPEADPLIDSVAFPADHITVSSERNMEPPQISDSPAVPFHTPQSAPARMPDMPSQTPTASAPPTDRAFDGVWIARLLSAVWLTGCVVLSLRLLAKVIILRGVFPPAAR